MNDELDDLNLRSRIANLKYLPDPERAFNNITTFLSVNPDYAGKIIGDLEAVSMLYCHSQFLANYSVYNPDALFHALANINTSCEVSGLRTELQALLNACVSLTEGMKIIRHFKKQKLLLITLRDILNHVDFEQTLFALSNLADAILHESLVFTEAFISQRYGMPEENSFAVIGLGKLGAQELNYSSDIDIIFVYKKESDTSGISTVHGGTINRISAFEYYTKLAEDITRFLASNTKDGFVYRVDLRLRPQGQRGSLVLSLRSYEEYYESWGQLWERAALLRARPLAGDLLLGYELLKTVQPFIYRKYLDFDAINEIKRMKSQVEQLKSGTLSNDIKRGYGGIREIEFFIQIFQLIYGGQEPMLREKRTLRALHRLLQKGLIGHEDAHQLSGNYLFLRVLEHRLQQMNDLQTHTLPSSDRELEILGRKMGFRDKGAFLSEISARRQQVRTIYDSLFQSSAMPQARGLGEPSAVNPLSNVYWDMDSPIEHLLAEELSKAGIKDFHKAIHCLAKVRNTIFSFQTLRGRRLLENIIPRFVSEALRGVNPDLALLHLADFSRILATRESYLEAIAQRKAFISGLNFVFSHSEYLSRILMSSPHYIESLVEDQLREKTLATVKTELKILTEEYGQSTATRVLKRLKEIKFGILFLNKKIDVVDLMRLLSRVAETILSSLLPNDSPVAIIAFGKLGGREIIFNSDLDLIFITPSEPTSDDTKTAERLLKVLMSYTKDGITYPVDARLRPEGSKGQLVNSIAGLKDYYEKSAHPWELQALLKARPVFADVKTKNTFMSLRQEILTKRGREMTVADLRKMREKIQRELSKDRDSSVAHHPPLNTRYDIKLGTGGLEELEFAVQYLQLKHCHLHPRLLVQGTVHAIRRLKTAATLQDADADSLYEIYIFYRSIETMLRLRNESVLRENTDMLQSLANFMKTDSETILTLLHAKREWVGNFWNELRN
ncbi:MAG: bifunctional [glutamate--ammonia ligase]-adenylyl-L-tyrosine phosphorylase/[glutamate--ammonia-ligase] adenylyltransferase [Dissulfurispiraceae bacterium]